MDLLARLLQFDPGRRASAEEAMAHEYFAMMHMERQLEGTTRGGSSARVSQPRPPAPIRGAGGESRF